MTLSKDTRRQAAAILKQALEAEEPLEQTLVKLQKQIPSASPIFETLARLQRRQKLLEVSRSRESWFKALGWYLARLFMWGALGTAVGAYLVFGARAADPVTWALIGAVGYYLLIQVCTPLRLRSEAGHLQDADQVERDSIVSLIERLESGDSVP